MVCGLRLQRSLESFAVRLEGAHHREPEELILAIKLIYNNLLKKTLLIHGARRLRHDKAKRISSRSYPYGQKSS